VSFTSNSSQDGSFSETLFPAYLLPGYHHHRIRYWQNAIHTIQETRIHAIKGVQNIVRYSRCIPSFLYSLVACPLNKTQLASLDFKINRFLMKLFCTSNMEIITCFWESLTWSCRVLFWLVIYTNIFLDKLHHCDNYMIIYVLCI